MIDCSTVMFSRVHSNKKKTSTHHLVDDNNTILLHSHFNSYVLKSTLTIIGNDIQLNSIVPLSKIGDIGFILIQN